MIRTAMSFHNIMRPISAGVIMLVLSACQSMPQQGSPMPPAELPRGTGQYVRPQYMNPRPLPRIPPTDACRSQLYQGLVGQPEGAIYIAGLPGTKRVIKPAFNEAFDYTEQDFLGAQAPYMEVRDYLPDQSLYVPSIRSVEDLSLLGEVRLERLTIELDRYGLVQEVRCG